MEKRELLTETDAASKLGISRLTFSKWRQLGKVVPMGTVGKVYVYDAEYIQSVSERITPHKPFCNRLAAEAAPPQTKG